jgi:hypothetical protein
MKPDIVSGGNAWLHRAETLAGRRRGKRLKDQLILVIGNCAAKRLVALTEPGAKAVMNKNFSVPNLPAHIEETVRSLAQLHADHHQNATPHERAVARVTALLGHPRFIGGLALVVAAWVTLNLLAAQLGYSALDPPPFSWLEGAVSLGSLSRKSVRTRLSAGGGSLERTRL